VQELVLQHVSQASKTILDSWPSVNQHGNMATSAVKWVDLTGEPV
jgi:hypothetical protein